MKLVTVEDKDHSILRKPASTVQFPLTTQTQQLLSDMKQFIIALDEDHGVAGMAAPQLNIDLRVIFIQFKRDWGEYRQDAVGEEIPLQPLINPSYDPIPEDGMSDDFEACFSVPNIAAEVSRYNSIHYHWQDNQGVTKTSTAQGFFARLLQHEIDHTKGILHTDLVKDDARIMTIDELMEARRKMREDLEV